MHTQRHVVCRLATRLATSSSSSSCSSSLWGSRCWCHTPQPMPQSERAARSVVLAHWNAVAMTHTHEGSGSKGDAQVDKQSGAAAADELPGTRRGKGMSFAGSLIHAPLMHSGAARSRQKSGNLIVDGTAAEVSWNVYERMDYLVQYCVPANWRVEEMVRENSVAIQCSPPRQPTGRPSLHGISVNCFAYTHKVSEPNSHKLLRLFLRRFNASVGNSLQVVSESGASDAAHGVDSEEDAAPHAAGQTSAGRNTSRELAARLHSAVAEVTFTAAPGQPLAHGLCRAFFSTTCRFHYITVVAVPEEEFAASQDLVRYALVSVTEMHAASSTAP